MLPERAHTYPGKLRVLVSGALPPPLGGVGVYYQTLLDSSLADRVDLHFVQTSTQKRELSGTGKVTFSNIIYAIQDCIRFTKVVWKFRPKLTHIATAIGLSFIKHSYCIFIARLFGSRVLLHPHCSMAVLYYQRPRWWQWYFRQVIRWTNGIVALSSEWLTLKSIYPDLKVFYLPNAINVNLFRDIAEKHFANGKLNYPCKILYIGSLHSSKGTFDILDAAAACTDRGIDMQIDLVGGALVAEDNIKMREQISRQHMADRVHIQPITFGEEKLNYLLNADIFIYPSYNEGMPMAVLEAMACGLPVIATRVGGLPDLIHDGINGILVDPGRPEQLSSALCKLADDSELRHSLGKASYKIAIDSFDIETHVEKLVDVYKSVMSA